MRKILLIAVLFLLVGYANAVTIDEACSSKGFNNTISSWVWSDGYFQVEGNDVVLDGTSHKAYWNSTVYIDGVVYKTANRTYLLEGGFNGTVPKTTTINDIEFIVFCSNDIVQIPEFGMIGMIVAAIIVIIIYKRRIS